MTNYSAWEITTEDFPNQGNLSEKLNFICGYAILAPSVHNTQPWRFEIKKKSVIISISKERSLGAGDPIGRETWISLGACIENLLIAAEYFGLKGNQVYHDNDSAEYAFEPIEPELKLKNMVTAITSRATNRSKYSIKAIPETVIAQLKVANRPDIHVRIEVDRNIIAQIADLTGRAIAIALSSPPFRHELSSLIRPNWTAAPTGMPGFSLGVSALRSAVEHKLVQSGTMIDSQADKETAAMLTSAAIVLISTAGDTPKYWLEAGRAYQRAGLIATAHGLSCATTAAVVEAADFHLDIEHSAGLAGRLQVIMRLGYSDTAVKHSPRLPLETVVTFSS